MPRFFFHLRGDGQNFEDAIGSEFETCSTPKWRRSEPRVTCSRKPRSQPNSRIGISRSPTGKARVSASYL